MVIYLGTDGKRVLGSREYVADKLNISLRTLSRRINKGVDEDGNRYLVKKGFEYVSEQTL